ncbi:MAG: T9SS C-terminal target domain-containing protein [Ignavibacteriae bacterium]|nr:MAG: T9SS C-terminal target domain-containing protein [Ignavibacteriota bacterium]
MKLKSYVFTCAVLLMLLTPYAFPQLEQIRVACIGNSITQGSSTTWPATLQSLLGSHYNVKNYGVGGTTMLKKGDLPYWNQSQFYEAQDFNPHIIFISLGTNDSKYSAVNNWRYGNEFYSDYRDFIKIYRQHGRNPQIYVCYPPPAFIDNYSITDTIIHYQIIPLIDSVRRVDHTLLIDWYSLMGGMSAYFPDGIHPSNEGYAIMGGWARDSILNSPGGFIRTFKASPQKYEQGDSVKLWWETSNGSQVTLNGVTLNGTDSLVVYPSGTAPYVLMAHGAQFSDTSRITLEYLPPGTIKSLNAIPPVLEKDAGDSTLIQWTTSKGSSVKFENVPVSMNSSMVVSPVSTKTYTLVAAGAVTDTATIEVPVLDAELINRATGQTVKSFSSIRNYPPESVIDGDTSTAWMSSSLVAGQWIYVDMGKSRPIDRVVLKWGARYATAYIIQSISSTGSVKSLFTTSAGDGGIDDVRGLNGTGRVVRIMCNERNLIDSGYTLKEFEIYTSSRAVGISGRSFSVPGQYALSQNYPNPFNPSTMIHYSLPARSLVNIKIFDLLGRRIQELVNDEMDSGEHLVEWRTDIASGIYFYRMEAAPVDKSLPSFRRTKMMVHLK